MGPRLHRRGNAGYWTVTTDPKIVSQWGHVSIDVEIEGAIVIEAGRRASQWGHVFIDVEI